MDNLPYAHDYDSVTGWTIREDVLTAVMDGQNSLAHVMSFQPWELRALYWAESAMFEQAWNDVRQSFTLAINELSCVTTATRLQVANRVLERLAGRKCAQSVGASSALR